MTPTYTPEFKLQILKEERAGISIAELSRRYDIFSGLIFKWKKEFKNSLKSPFSGKGSRSSEKAKIAQMERLR